MYNPQEAFFLQWHLTDRCNLSCRHCYRGDLRPDLNGQQIKTVFANFQRLRSEMPQPKTRVQIAGGEPLLSEHLFPVLDMAASAGYQARILTNGTLIDGRMAREIRAHGCSIVQVSIDGLAPVHDSIRGAGNFEKALAGARLLREQGVKVTFAMTVSRENISEVPAVFELARQEADRLSFHRLVPCGRGGELKTHMLSDQEIKQVLTVIWEKRQQEPRLEVPLRDPLWKPFLRQVDVAPWVDGCSAGYGGICVESNGDIYPCRRMPIVIGNALSDEMAEVWNCRVMGQLRNRDLLTGRCGKCPLRWKCGGCRAIGLAMSGEMLSEDPQCFYKPNWGERLAYRLINDAYYRSNPVANDGGA